MSTRMNREDPKKLLNQEWKMREKRNGKLSKEEWKKE